MKPATRLYVGAVIAAGAWLLAASSPRALASPALALTWLGAMLVVSLFKLRMPLGRGQSTMSMASVIDFAVVVTAGADLAMVIAAAGVLVQCTVRVGRPQPWYRTAFSVAAVALAVQAAGATWVALGGTLTGGAIERTAIPLAACTLIYFIVNSGLVAVAIALSNGASLLATWTPAFVRTLPAYLIAAAAGAAMPMLLAREVWLLAPVALIPILLCHLAYAGWFRRLATQTTALALT